MPERWERELRKLRGVDPNEHAIRERAGRGPSSARRLPRRNALAAGIVAGAVAIAGVALLGQLSLDDGREIGGTDDLPTLLVTFESNGFIADQPDEQTQRIDTTIAYGDAREESFTSITPDGAHVDYVEVERITFFVPGPTVGSPVQIDADGQDARVLIGELGDWPRFDRFTPIEQLPDEPGDYVLLFEASYPDGVARTPRLVHVVPRGVLQLDVTEGKSLHAATAVGYLDGRRVDGFLSQSWFTLGDVGAQSDPATPDFEPDAWFSLPSGSPMTLVRTPTEARAGLLPRYGDFDLNDPLPIDLLEGATIDGPDGRQLLAVDVTWRHGPHPLREEATEERAVFFFPVEIVTEQETMPTPVETPSPGSVGADAIVIDIRRSSEETGSPEAIARFGAQEQWMCPDHFTRFNPDGTEETVMVDCGQSDVFLAPVGTPIEVTGDFATLKVSAGVTGNRHPGTGEAVPPLEPGTIITLAYEVTWDDGSEASFWLLLTVQDTGSTTGEPGILVRIYGLGERSTEVPAITMTYGGETKRGCTEAFDWTLPDGTRIDEASGRNGSILPQCSYEPLFTVPPGVPIILEVPTASEVFATRTTTPLYDGRDGFGASVRWPGGGKGDFTVTFEVVGSPADQDIQDIRLDCAAEEDWIAFTTPDGPRILPGGSAYIRGNMEGFQQTDVIEQMTQDPDGSTEWDGVWQVVRDGSVIAAVEFGSLRGVACRGSGIGGV
jgi:hypothetical protein